MPLVLPRIEKSLFEIIVFTLQFTIGFVFIETTNTVDSETNDFAGSKKNVAQKTGLTKDGEWAPRRPFLLWIVL